VKNVKLLGALLMFAVSAVMLTGCGQIKDAINTVASKASAPNPTAAAGNGAVTISWPEVSGAVKYNIYWSSNPGVNTSNGQAIVDVSSPYTVANLHNGTTYYFVVTSLNLKGESGPSTELSATPSASAAPFIRATVLTSPGGTPPWGYLTMVQVSSTSSDSTPITTAAVSVNGTNLPWNPAKNEYDGNVAIAPGTPVTVNVNLGGHTYAATGTQVSAVPTIITPPADGTWSHSSPNMITWTPGVPAAGNVYVAGILNSSGDTVYPAGDHGPQEVATNTTALAVPANALTPGSYQVLAGIGTPGIATGTGSGIPIPNALPGSGLFLGGISLVPITVQ
jgi:hypothetical protein